MKRIVLMLALMLGGTQDLFAGSFKEWAIDRQKREQESKDDAMFDANEYPMYQRNTGGARQYNKDDDMSDVGEQKGTSSYQDTARYVDVSKVEKKKKKVRDKRSENKRTRHNRRRD